MADLYGTGAACAAASPPSPSSAAATAGGFPLDRDDFSIFLHNLLQSSASSSASPNPSSAFMPLKPKHLPPALSPPQPPPSEPRPDGGIVVPPEDLLRASGSADFAGASCRERDDGAGPSSSLNLSDPGGFCSAEASERTAFSDLIASSAKRRSSLDDLGSDSQKGPEAAEMPSKPAPPRSSSKRSRAAEVHNLSEKRRRSRINEKMKALQMLIPNSNKTDKASMLDEAIEYLKQLQLQVQMLSMRNGLSLHSLYVPGVVQPMQLAQAGMGFEDGNGLPTANGEFSANQGAAMHSAFDISNECTPSHQPTAIPAVTHASNSLSPFGLEPSIPAHYGPFNPSLSSKEICREDTLPLLQLDMGMAEKKSSDVSS